MNIVVPQLGESVIEARVARWLKQEGESVAAGEALVELETDKIDLEVNAESAGVLSRIERKQGDDVKVGETLGVLEEGASAGAAPKDAAAAPTKNVGPNFSSADQAAAPVAAAPKDVGQNVSSADQAGSPKKDVGPNFSSAEQAGPPAIDVKATPTARRMADDHRVELSQIRGTGEGGRVTKEDVQKFVAAGGQPETGRPIGPVGPNFSSAGPSAAAGPAATMDRAPAAPPAAPSTPPPAPQPQPAAPAPSARQAPTAPPPAPRPAGTRTEERVRMSKRRATIARRLVEAQRTAAMLTTFNEVDMSAVQALRGRRKESFQKRFGVSLGLSSFFVKAAVGALKSFPRINAEVQGDEMVLKHYYDIGIAVGASGGLVVPVLRDADRMTFWEIESSIKNFAKRADDGSLTLDEITGGTFTITNGGVFGSLLSTPILNPPQVGILGLHKIEERPFAVGGQVVIRPMMYLALSYDHRIVDGLEAVQFLVKIKEFIEDPGHLLIEG